MQHNNSPTGPRDNDASTKTNPRVKYAGRVTAYYDAAEGH